MPEAHTRRSRFDRGDAPEPTRGPPRKRFDRSRSRSRSPARKDAAPVRERSPIARARSQEATDSPSTVASNTLDPSPALAAAQKIAAAVAARKKTAQPLTPTMPRPTSSSRAPSAAHSTKSPSEAIEGFPQAKYYQEAGDHVCLVEINDLRNKYTLTKGDVHKQIHNETGADVTQKGQYYPDKSLATPANPPLQLQITATTHESMYAAVMKIKDMIDMDLPKLVDERRFRRREPENIERDEFGRRKWPEEKLPIDLEPISGFNLRAQVVGRGGDNVKYIQTTSGCKVQIKGRGSGFAEHSTNAESDEPMYLHITGPKEEGVARARVLCEELLEKVRNDYEEFKKNPPQRRYQDNDRQSNGRPGYGDRGGRGGGYGDRRNNSYNNGNSGYGTPDYAASYPQQPSAQSPIADASGANNQAMSAEQQAQWAAYYQQNPQADIYAAYGGYDAYMQLYTQYYGTQGYTGYEQQQQQAGPPGAAPPGYGGPPGGTASAPPPPPPSEPGPPGGAPPPPPPPDSPPGYNTIPPPPGL